MVVIIIIIILSPILVLVQFHPADSQEQYVIWSGTLEVATGGFGQF